MVIRLHLIRSFCFIVLLLLTGAAKQAAAQSTAFTYQGKLTDSGNLANGSYDFQFKLFDTATVGTGTQQGGVVTLSPVTVTSGGFSVSLDFGVCASCFNGSARFLEIAIKPTSGGSFTTLTPRQPILSSPYGIRSLNAAAADGLSVACVNCITSSQIQSVNGSAVTGIIPVASVPAGSTNYVQNSTTQQAASNFNISGDGTAGGRLTGNFVSALDSFDIGEGGPILYARRPSNNPTVPKTNIFVGILAGTPSLTGVDNSVFGFSSGFSLTSGAFNSFFGSRSGSVTSLGSNNSFFGFETGLSNTEGTSNSFFGYRSGGQNYVGNNNSFFGTAAGEMNVSGNANVFFGQGAGAINSVGSSNTFIGSSAGGNDTGSNNTLLGFGSKTLQGNLLNATAVGNRAAVGQSNSLILGSISGINGATADTNVGIGTTSPTERLHVVGNGLITGNLTVNGTLNLPSFAGQFIQNTTTQQANSNFNISGNGIVGGNGIIGGTLSVGNAGTSARLYMNRASPIATNSADINFFSAGSPDFSLGTSQGSAAPADFSIYNYGTGSNALTIQKASGNVGIGTTVPNAKLQVVSGNDTGVRGDTTNSYGVLGSSTNNYGVYGVSANSIGIYGESTGTDVNNSVGMRGVSTNSYGVFGTSFNRVGVRGVSTNDYGVKGESTNRTGVVGVSSAVDGVAGFSTNYYGVRGESTNDYGVYGISYTNNAAGVFGYSNSSPGVKGESGTGRGVYGRSLSAGGVVGESTLGPGIAGVSTDGDGVYGTTSNINRYAGYFQGDVYVTGIVIQFSDAQRKQNINTLGYGLAEVLRLRPVTWRWKEHAERGLQLGLVAQEVEPVLPELVSTTKDAEQTKGVNYIGLVPILVNAIQEQQQQLEQYRTQLAQQQARERQQQQEIAAIKQLLCASQPAAEFCKTKAAH